MGANQKLYDTLEHCSLLPQHWCGHQECFLCFLLPFKVSCYNTPWRYRSPTLDILISQSIIIAKVPETVFNIELEWKNIYEAMTERSNSSDWIISHLKILHLLLPTPFKKIARTRSLDFNILVVFQQKSCIKCSFLKVEMGTITPFANNMQLFKVSMGTITAWKWGK